MKFHRFLLIGLVGAVFSLTPSGAQDMGAPLSDSLWDGFNLQLAASKAHRALGYITPTLGLATYLTMLGEGEGEGDGDEAGGGHRLLGTTAAWAAGLNLVLGLVAHWDHIDVITDPGRLLTRDALHAVVSATGAGFMVAAGFQGGRDGHDFYGEAGTFLMGSAILLEW